MTRLPATSVATRRRLSAPNRARQLLDVAATTFAARGFTGTTMDEIAERAGVSKPVLYDHYASKAGLLAAVVEEAGEQLQQAVADAVASSGSPERQFADGLRAYFRFTREHATLWSLVMGDRGGAAVVADAVEQIRDAQAEFLRATILCHLPDADPPAVAVWAQLVIGAAERLATVGGTGAPLDPDRATAQVMDVLWLGFATLRTGRRWQP